MAFFRASLSFLVTLACLVNVITPATATCQLCPTNSTMMGGTNPIPIDLYNFSFPATDCNAIDTGLSYVPSFFLCSRAVSAIQKAFDAQSYCECTSVVSPTVCKLCNVVTNIGGFVQTGPFLNFTCNEVDRFFQSLTSSKACSSPADLISLCCPSESNRTASPTVTGATASPTSAAITQTTPSPVAGGSGGGVPTTMAPSPSSPTTRSPNTMPTMPTTKAPASSPSSGGGTSPTTGSGNSTNSTSHTSGAVGATTTLLSLVVKLSVVLMGSLVL